MSIARASLIFACAALPLRAASARAQTFTVEATIPPHDASIGDAADGSSVAPLLALLAARRRA
jgi:hypothetical protein